MNAGERLTVLYRTQIIECEPSRFWAIRATSAPRGRAIAWDRLQSTFPPRAGRRFYGLLLHGCETPVYYAAVDYVRGLGALPAGIQQLRVDAGTFVCIPIPESQARTDSINRHIERIRLRYETVPGRFTLECFRGDGGMHLMVPVQL